MRDFRQCGMIMAFEVAERAARFRALVLRRRRSQRGLLLRPIGSTVYFMPPYIVSDDEFGLLVERTLAILDDC